MPKGKGNELQTSGFKFRGLEKRGLNPNPRAKIPERPPPPKPIKTRLSR